MSGFHPLFVFRWRSHEFLVNSIYHDNKYYKKLDIVDYIRTLRKNEDDNQLRSNSAKGDASVLTLLKQSRFYVFTGQQDKGSLLQQQAILNETMKTGLAYVLNLVRDCGHGSLNFFCSFNTIANINTPYVAKMPIKVGPPFL